MSDVAEMTAEVVADNVEEAVDGIVEVVEVARNNPYALAAVGFVGVAIGAAGGYFFAKKQLQKVYEDRVAAEIAQAKEFYASVNKVDVDGAVLTPMDVMHQRHPEVAEAAEALREYQGLEHDQSDDEMDEALLAKTESKVKVVSAEEDGTLMTTEVQESTNVFDDPTFDLEEERKFRTPTKPYIIHHDEYFEAEREFDTIQLTYFEADDTLIDEQNNPITDVDATVGEDHLVMFGRGSKDKNIVYVRNERLEVDYEISRSNGSYLKEVLGMDDEEDTLRHSDMRDRRRAFRHGDG